MTRSHVLVPSAGTIKLATNQYTDGANVKDDEVTVAGLPFLPTYNVGGFAVVTTTANSHMLQIMAGASLAVYIARIRLYQITLSTAAILAAFEIRRLTTAGTGGGVVTGIALDSTDAASGATGMTLPTAKGTEGNALHLFSVYMLQTLPTAVDFNPLRWEWNALDARMKPIRISAGATNGIAIKNVTASAVGALTIAVDYYEASY